MRIVEQTQKRVCTNVSDLNASRIKIIRAGGTSVKSTDSL